MFVVKRFDFLCVSVLESFERWRWHFQNEKKKKHLIDVSGAFTLYWLLFVGAC